MAWKASVLVVANVTAASDELLEAVTSRAAREDAEFTLVVPATGGGKPGREAAMKQVDAALERMRGAGLEVKAKVGDPDPVMAVQDLWDPAKFDEVIVSTLPTGASKWLLVDLPHRVQRMTDAPVTHVVARERKEVTPRQAPEKRKSSGLLEPLTVLGWGKQADEEPGAGR
jgi:hypothetical protein